MFSFSITLALFLVVYSAGATYQNGQNSKRLLLDDPEIIIKRISNMEKQIAQLQADLSGEKSKNVNLESQMAIIQTKNADVEKEVTHLKTELGDEKNKYVTLRQTVDAMKTPGSIYVRWGRKTCSGLQTELVYTGFAAGQNYYDPDYSIPVLVELLTYFVYLIIRNSVIDLHQEGVIYMAQNMNKASLETMQLMKMCHVRCVEVLIPIHQL